MFFSCHHHKFLLKQVYSEKQNLKTSNISHSKRKTFEKDSNTALTTRQCHIRFGNGQTIGNLGVYHRFRSLEYRSRKSGTKTQSYCQSRRTWLEITFGTSKILTHWPKNLKKKISLLFYFLELNKKRLLFYRHIVKDTNFIIELLNWKIGKTKSLVSLCIFRSQSNQGETA